MKLISAVSVLLMIEDDVPLSIPVATSLQPGQLAYSTCPVALPYRLVLARPASRRPIALHSASPSTVRAVCDKHWGSWKGSVSVQFGSS